jgi:hypothetical protein
VYDTHGNRIVGEVLVKRLQREVLGLGSVDGNRVDPLHLRLVNEGTLVFVFPPFRPEPVATAY